MPSTVQVDMAWVLNRGEAWRTVPREERSRAATAPNHELVARDGPKWGPGVTVDVVVRLLDPNGRWGERWSQAYYAKRFGSARNLPQPLWIYTAPSIRSQLGAARTSYSAAMT